MIIAVDNEKEGSWRWVGRFGVAQLGGKATASRAFPGPWLWELSTAFHKWKLPFCILFEMGLQSHRLASAWIIF